MEDSVMGAVSSLQQPQSFVYPFDWQRKALYVGQTPCMFAFILPAAIEHFRL